MLGVVKRFSPSRLSRSAWVKQDEQYTSLNSDDVPRWWDRVHNPRDGFAGDGEAQVN